MHDRISTIENQYPDTPSLYFIDPFGLDPLRADAVRRSLSGTKNEALILFADQAALRHFGAITADETRAERRYRVAATPIPLFPELESAGIGDLANAALQSRDALDMTSENALRIMNAAYGDKNCSPKLNKYPRIYVAAQ